MYLVEKDQKLTDRLQVASMIEIKGIVQDERLSKDAWLFHTKAHSTRPEMSCYS